MWSTFALFHRLVKIGWFRNLYIPQKMLNLINFIYPLLFLPFMHYFPLLLFKEVVRWITVDVCIVFFNSVVCLLTINFYFIVEFFGIWFLIGEFRRADAHFGSHYRHLFLRWFGILGSNGSFKWWYHIQLLKKLLKMIRQFICIEFFLIFFTITHSFLVEL